MKYKIISDKGFSAECEINMDVWENVPDDIQTNIIRNEIQTLFCRLFDTPAVKVGRVYD